MLQVKNSHFMQELDDVMLNVRLISQNGGNERNRRKMKGGGEGRSCVHVFSWVPYIFHTCNAKRTLWIEA